MLGLCWIKSVEYRPRFAENSDEDLPGADFSHCDGVPAGRQSRALHVSSLRWRDSVTMHEQAPRARQAASFARRCRKEMPLTDTRGRIGTGAR